MPLSYDFGMSFQKGNTFVFGETPAASKWDQLWRNDDALADGSGLDDNSITTAKLADGSVTTAKLADGSVTAAKINSTTLPSSRTCLLQKSGGQSIPNATITPITFTSELYDPSGMHDNSSNPSRVTINTTGIYHVTATANFASNTGGTYRIIKIRVNGSTVVAEGAPRYDAEGRWGATVTANLSLSAGNYVEMTLEQNSGGSLNSFNHHLAVIGVA